MSERDDAMYHVVRAYLAAFNNSDFAAIVRLYAPDAVVEDPVGSTPKQGTQEIRGFYAMATAMKIEASLEGEVRVVANAAAFAFSIRFLKDGRYTKIRPIAVFDFDADLLITHTRVYFGEPNYHY